MNRTTERASRDRRSVIAILTAMLCAFLLLFTGVAPASAASVNLSGQQNENSTVWWSTGRLNLHSQNRMSFTFSTLNNGWNTSMVVGARNPVGAVNSFAKTPGIAKGTNKSFTMVSTGSYAIPSGTFYLTTYLGWYGCPGCPGTWTGTLYYSLPYP